MRSSRVRSIAPPPRVSKMPTMPHMITSSISCRSALKYALIHLDIARHHRLHAELALHARASGRAVAPPQCLVVEVYRQGLGQYAGLRRRAPHAGRTLRLALALAAVARRLDGLASPLRLYFGVGVAFGERGQLDLGHRARE